MIKMHRLSTLFIAITTLHMTGKVPYAAKAEKHSSPDALECDNCTQPEAKANTQKESTVKSELVREVQKEVLAKLLEQLAGRDELLKKRSHCCTCICPSKDDFFDGDRPLELCNIDLNKIAADELLVTDSACFDGSVCFAGDIEGLPGLYCWNPVECPEWEELDLKELPESCFPQCGEMVLDSFDAREVRKVAFSYQTKDGADALPYLLPITVTLANLLLLYTRDVGPIFKRPKAHTARLISRWHNDPDNCFIAVELGLGLGSGEYTEDSCVCQARTI